MFQEKYRPHFHGILFSHVLVATHHKSSEEAAEIPPPPSLPIPFFSKTGRYPLYPGSAQPPISRCHSAFFCLVCSADWTFATEVSTEKESDESETQLTAAVFLSWMSRARTKNRSGRRLLLLLLVSNCNPCSELVTSYHRPCSHLSTPVPPIASSNGA